MSYNSESWAARVGAVPDTRNPYTTSYGLDYPEKKSVEAFQVRPKTLGEKAYVADYDISDPIGPTHYQSEYHRSKKMQDHSKNPWQPVKTGVGAGFRRNNPHPFHTFQYWKLPKDNKYAGDYRGSCSEDLSNEMYDKVMRGMLSSTYQDDYTGAPQGYPIDKMFNIHVIDSKARAPYTLDTATRQTYQEPVQQPELLHPMGRYAANAGKFKKAVGIAPSVTKRHMFNLKTKTTYDCEYNDAIIQRPAQARQSSRLYAESFQGHMERQQEPWAFAQKSWEGVSHHVPSPSPPSTGSAYSRPGTSRGRKFGYTTSARGNSLRHKLPSATELAGHQGQPVPNMMTMTPLVHAY